MKLKIQFLTFQVLKSHVKSLVITIWTVRDIFNTESTVELLL